MNSLTEIAVVGKISLRERSFRICYLTAIAVAMVGWLSAFGWVTLTVAKWLLA
jgi:hypothetical protein